MTKTLYVLPHESIETMKATENGLTTSLSNKGIVSSILIGQQIKREMFHFENGIILSGQMAWHKQTAANIQKATGLDEEAHVGSYFLDGLENLDFIDDIEKTNRQFQKMCMGIPHDCDYAVVVANEHFVRALDDNYNHMLGHNPFVGYREKGFSLTYEGAWGVVASFVPQITEEVNPIKRVAGRSRDQVAYRQDVDKIEKSFHHMNEYRSMAIDMSLLHKRKLDKVENAFFDNKILAAEEKSEKKETRPAKRSADFYNRMIG